MTNFSDILAHGTAHAWLYFPSAILLGALHGLEPGHSKTLMAAFIVAVRGTVKQAVMLGIAATVSHTAVVWIVAIGGMYLGRHLDAHATEPYFQLASAGLVIVIAAWMLWRTWSGEQAWRRQQQQSTPDHAHDAARQIDTGHGRVELSIVAEGEPARWRLKTLAGNAWAARDVVLTTLRPDGKKQRFAFNRRPDYLESMEPVPEPHAFDVRLSMGHGGHSHDYDLAFHARHGVHAGNDATGPGLTTDDGYQDAHERAHANDIRRRFSQRDVTTRQIIVFGLTGGLVPCPAAITVLLLCLQLQQIALGAVLVLCFSVGLAVTLVTVGAAAAIGARKATSRWPWLGNAARRAPYLSSTLMIVVGLYVAFQGYAGLAS
ncbi:nickel/cobalt efflux transporter [Robbsia sp. Bb-Pol-6]|uniref:Nickel/cobalt efflux system n=1 Tax=Robbsia betulipollinis TaxID=2981849 RepID=A0ABT3ZM55_9BURK|nr:nickel/cobalt efflux transporter [Robbsia betulipollinis]MCY0387033.1 nickel/cobalt efflux transporter [Robbsia betulipollinis]